MPIQLLLQADYQVNIASELIKQGPLITALIMAIMYFYRRQEKQEAANQRLNDKLESYLKEDRDSLQKVVENNSRVVEEMQQFMEKVEARLERMEA